MVQRKKNDGEDVDRILFLKVKYPMDVLMEVMFLSYNWLYVNQYLKTALFLPIMLTGHSLPNDQVVQ